MALLSFSYSTEQIQSDINRFCQIAQQSTIWTVLNTVLNFNTVLQFSLYVWTVVRRFSSIFLILLRFAKHPAPIFAHKTTCHMGYD